MRVNREKKEEMERMALSLMRATLRLAAAHGFAGLGLREVARAAEIAPTSFYRYFPDMERLGVSLIDGLVHEFLRGWAEGSGPVSARTSAGVEAIADRALSSAAVDPELMRFILAERVGAIATLRAALARELSLLAAAVQAALVTDARFRKISAVASDTAIADAVVALVLEACNQALERTPEQLVALRKRLLDQIGLVLTGVLGMGGST